MIFIDSNVMIDLLERDAAWGDWSRRSFAAAQVSGPVAINHIVVAELASQIADADDLEAMLFEMGLLISPFTNAAALRSGRAFHEYRRRGGERHSILADFLIGAHAATLGATLLTRDKRRIASYFPELTLITPETDSDG